MIWNLNKLIIVTRTNGKTTLIRMEKKKNQRNATSNLNNNKPTDKNQ